MSERRTDGVIELVPVDEDDLPVGSDLMVASMLGNISGLELVMVDGRFYRPIMPVPSRPTFDDLVWPLGITEGHIKSDEGHYFYTGRVDGMARNPGELRHIANNLDLLNGATEWTGV